MRTKLSTQLNDLMKHQTVDCSSLQADELARLVVSYINVDGNWVIQSRFVDDVWLLSGGPTNVQASRKTLDFNKVPVAFRPVVKQIMYRYLRRGREGFGQPAVGSVVRAFISILPFLRYLDRLGIGSFTKATPIICFNFVEESKAKRKSHGKGKPLSANTLQDYFSGVELLHELSHYSSMPFLMHPWPESSAKHLAGLTGRLKHGKTPVMPDDVFTTLFQQAWTVVQAGRGLLALRDEVDELTQSIDSKSRVAKLNAIRKLIKPQGWHNWREYSKGLTRLRTACYIVIASLSGCRNHELSYLKSDATYSTEGEDGEVYWWMRSQSDKSGVGLTEWMIPELAVEAIRVMELWAIPLQRKLHEQISQLRAADPNDPEISEAQRHVGAVFLTTERKPHDRVRTHSLDGWNAALQTFAEECDLDWKVATHHFRRKFANYAARSKYGDLRYLREHFKHWSQDVTNDSYALNESQEIELYAEIQEELETLKLGIASHWLNPAEPLAGGYGKHLVEWRSRGENIAMFRDHATMVRSVAKSHAIRSNGHAWCTADDNRCIGNSFEKTRCGGCENAVIGRTHARLYRRIYADLIDVLKSDDIGAGGKARVERDLIRCRDVLTSLGYEIEGALA